MDLKNLTYGDLIKMREDLAKLVYTEQQKEKQTGIESITLEYWNTRLLAVQLEMTERLKSINN